MADLKHVQANRIRTEMAAETASRRKLVLMIGTPLALACTFWGDLNVLPWIVLSVVYFILGGVKDRARQSGAAGEDYTLKALSNLPENYTIFNQVEVPDERSRTGTREVDFIVCGPNGIFVVESKNHNGTVAGGEHDESWTVHKVGRRGGAYSSQVRNPVKQVKTQVAVLNKYFRSRGLNPSITGVVTFSSNNDLSMIDSGSIHVTGSAAVADWIRNAEPRGAVKDLAKIIEAVRSLRVNQAKAA